MRASPTRALSAWSNRRALSGLRKIPACTANAAALAGRKDLQNHFGNPGVRHSEAASCRFGDIDDPPPAVRAAVVDPHHDAVAAIDPPDPHVGAEWERTMGGGKRLRIVYFTTGGNLPVKRFPVSACDALFRARVRPR